MAKQDKDNGKLSLKSGKRSFGSDNVSLNDDIERMRANFEANPFKYKNGNGVLLVEQVVGEDGQVYESAEEAEESEAEQDVIEAYNDTWAMIARDTVNEALENGFGNDEENADFFYEIEEDIEEAWDANARFNDPDYDPQHDPYDRILMERYSEQSDDFVGPPEAEAEMMGPPEAAAGDELVGPPEASVASLDEDFSLIDPSQQTEAVLAEMSAEQGYDDEPQAPVATQPTVNSASFGSTDPAIETNVDPTAAFAAAAAPPPATQPTAPEVGVEAANDATFEEEPIVSSPQAAPAPAFG